MYLVDTVYSSDSEDWYTPVEYINASRRVLERIDLDPASCELANKIVRATRYYTKEQDGLSQSWYGRVWLNPPSGRAGTDRQKGKTELWVERLMQEYRAGNVIEAIMLVHAHLYKQWFRPLFDYPICFPTGRIAFWNAKGDAGRSPHSSAIVYFGSNEQRFVDVFDPLGAVEKRLLPTPKQALPTLWELSK